MGLKKTTRTPPYDAQGTDHCCLPCFAEYMDRSNPEDRFFYTARLLMVLKQPKEEVLDIIFGENTFYLDITQNQQIWVVPSNLQRVRKLQVSTRKTVNEGMKFLDKELWSNVLPKLNRLELALEQPGFIGGNIETEQDVDNWLDWLHSFLQHLSGVLPEECEVAVYDQWGA